MKPSLPIAVRWVVRLVVPARSRDQVLSDLEDDYARVHARRRPFAARWWLFRETTSVMASYSAAPFERAGEAWPAWSRDVRLVIRAFRRGGALTAAGAAAMLAVGLLAVLVTAGLSQTLLFRQVSASYGDRLRRVGTVDRDGRTSLSLSFVEVQIIREYLGVAATVSTVNMQPVVIRAGETSVQTMVEVVDGSYFTVIGAAATLGRALLEIDDRPEAPPVVVVGERFWRDHLAGSPAVLGQPVHLNGRPYVIVGVARALGSSSFMGGSVDAWVPVAHADPVLNRGWRSDLGNRWFTAFALATGTSAEVEGRLDAAAQALARMHPDRWRDRRLRTSEATVMTGSQRASAMMVVGVLAGLSVLILVAAASNVGGVLLARAAASRRQVAIHFSLGSGRAAIVRRYLIEGVAIGLASGCLALGLYMGARQRLAEIALLPTLALRLELPLEAGLVVAVIAVAVMSGMAIAAGPAIWATRVDLAAGLGDEGSGATGGRRVTWTRRLLVSAQICVSVALVVGAALFTQSLDAMLRVDVGFTRDRLVAMDFDLEPSSVPPAELPGLAREALARAESTPGVVAAALSNRAPIDQSTPGIEVRATSDAVPVGDVTSYLVTPRYFETIGMPLVAGRPFTPAEADDEADVVIVNETLAARLWPAGDALDRPLYLTNERNMVRVVAVARDSKYRSISEPRRPHVYRPTPAGLGLTLLARSTADPRETLRLLQRTLDGVGPGVVGFFPRTLDDHIAIDVLPVRAAAAASSVLGALALLLSAVGLYGLVSWFVELRRREIGIRMALGANAGAVRALVVRQTLSTAWPGAAAGIVLAACFAFFARALLFGVGAFDPLAFLAGMGSLGVVTTLAAYLPARRATRVDPIVALKNRA
jgi:predicted permease